MKITHDMHNHTLFSSCCYDPAATMKAFVDKAYELGHSVIGISNHLWDEKVPGANGWYKGQTIDYGFEGKYAIPADTHGVKVLFGTETEYCGLSDTLGMKAETAARFDFVQIPHTHTHMKNFVIAENPDVKAYRAKLAADIEAALPSVGHDYAVKMAATVSYADVLKRIENPTVDEYKYLADFCFTSFESLMKNPEFKKVAAATPTFVAHPFWACGISRDEVNRVFDFILAEPDRLYADFKTCAELGVGLDVNMGCYKADEDGTYMNDPQVKVMRIAKSAGCKFVFGTDSHSVSGLESIRKGDLVSEAIGITEEDLADIVK